MFERIVIVGIKALIGLFVAASAMGAGIMVWLAWANPGQVAAWERCAYICIAGMVMLCVDLWLPDRRV